jgi:mannose-6-phosphate isomerase-like protein (cupin superfamily)
MTKAKRKAKSASPKPTRAPRRSTRKSKSAAKKGAAAAWRDQDFTISHQRDQDFKTEGLRGYAAYRDLGITAATRGKVRAHIIRNVRSFNAQDVSKTHYHKVRFQMVYCIRGWMKSEFEGQGVHEMRAGTCWVQPPGIKHTVLGYSDDLELLEIIMPADFDTVDVPSRRAAR